MLKSLNIFVKYGTAALAGFTSLGALLIIGFTVATPQGEIWWIGARLLVAAYVVAMGILTGLHLRMATPSPARTELLLLGAIGLLALGSAGAVWGFHMAEVTGDLEAWAIMINLFMAAQGGGTIWHLWHTKHPEWSVTS